MMFPGWSADHDPRSTISVRCAPDEPVEYAAHPDGSEMLVCRAQSSFVPERPDLVQEGARDALEKGNGAEGQGSSSEGSVEALLIESLDRLDGLGCEVDGCIGRLAGLARPDSASPRLGIFSSHFGKRGRREFGDLTDCSSRGGHPIEQNQPLDVRVRV